MHIVRTIAELDRKIAECDAAERISDDAMRAVFAGFSMEVPADLPVDPFSEEYRLQQLELYKYIAGDAYSPDKEVTRFDVDAALARPFPFTTSSTTTAGEYFMAIGFILKTMALPPGSRVLEFGAGWGFTSLWLAQLGHHVTVVDIEPCFCDLIARRAAREVVSIRVINDEFFWVEGKGSHEQFDAVLFYECFHHCSDHMRLLHALRGVVGPGGRIFFGGEPIVADFPYPWGLRLDGCALWGIRKNGWMELGFRDDYFMQALAQAGWFARKIAVDGAARLQVWEARHWSDAIFRFSGNDPRLQTHVGSRRDSAIVLDQAAKGTGLFGPYIDLPPGRYTARILFRPGETLRGQAVIDVVCNSGRTQLAQGKLDTRPHSDVDREVEMIFQSSADMQGVEVRLFGEAGFTAMVDSVEIVPLQPGAEIR